MPKRLRRELSSTTSRSALHRHWTAQNRKAWDAMRAQARAADPVAIASDTLAELSGQPAAGVVKPTSTEKTTER
jgi:hypothetical protein